MENTVSHGADGCALTEVVAIDGPAGAGKSTVARNAAAQLGFAFLDTGAMYRAATWWALEQGVDLGDSAAVEAATRALPLELREDGMLRVFVGERDVSAAIRTPEVTRCISRSTPTPVFATTWWAFSALSRRRMAPRLLKGVTSARSCFLGQSAKSTSTRRSTNVPGGGRTSCGSKAFPWTSTRSGRTLRNGIART